jgi:hypothetical protein
MMHARDSGGTIDDDVAANRGDGASVKSGARDQRLSA